MCDAGEALPVPTLAHDNRGGQKLKFYTGVSPFFSFEFAICCGEYLARAESTVTWQTFLGETPVTIL
jgi:hypothetical protein